MNFVFYSSPRQDLFKVDAGIVFVRKAKNAGIASATARLFNAASGKKSKSKCINLALENYNRGYTYQK